MRLLTLLSVLLIGAGTFLLWKRPSYSQRRDVLEVGDFKASVRTEESLPLWIGPTLIAVGVGALLAATRGRAR